MEQQSPKLIKLRSSFNKNEVDPKTLKQYNDLRNLLSIQKNPQFEDELSNLTMHQQKILNSLRRPNWIEKLQNSSDSKQNRRKNLSNLTPIAKDFTSRNNDPESNLVTQRKTFDRSNMSVLNQTMDYNSIIEPYFSLRKNSHKQPQILKGNNFDQAYMNKESKLIQMKQQIEELKLENDQIKNLNARLVERIDYLQNIIDKEADGTEFYYNYPPKPDEQLLNDVRQMKDRSTLEQNNQTQPEKKQNEQIAKIRKLYDDKIERDKRLAERSYNEMQRSFTLEIDQLQEILSQQCKAHIQLSNQHDNVVSKFNNYYTECDKYIADRELRLKQLKQDNNDLQQNLDQTTNLFNREKMEHEALKQTHSQYLEQYNVMKDENVKLRKEVMMYEEKYKFIDIGKLHEKIQLLTTQLDQSEKQRKRVQYELFDLRDKIFKATSKRISPRSKDFSDTKTQLGFGTSPGKENADHDKQWKGEDQVEETAQAMLEYIHNEISGQFPKGNQLNQWTNYINTQPGLVDEI
ncbi:UNKNOWN [Stylonychia lemnae]|uniref:Uncharacterized protein n=1 Tax=Stylonychia lemnae TaxID=5949 RepID=A0A078A2F1_STYLE|nr:UNKNOWN [Stylonychia lemnae]|eukprot:CDW75703.1 UNKNOWN [Stylonychia lemnae]